MSLAPTLSAHSSLLATLTVRQYLRAGRCAFAAIGVGCLIYAVETLWIRPRREFLENPTDVMMRALGLAHFIVGWIYLFTSPRLRGSRALGRLSLTTLLGAGLCVLFGLGGGMRNPLLLLLFYGYFLIHEIRDETELYQIYGDAPTGSEQVRRFLGTLSWAGAVLAAALMVAAFSLHGSAVERAARYTAAPQVVLPLTVVVLLAAGLWLGARAIHVGRAAHGDLRTALVAHRPLLVVYGGIFAVLLLGTLAGSAGFNLIILMHVCAWLVFVHFQLGRRPAPSGGWWTWLRGTPTGFVVLHLAVAMLILVLMAVRVHVWERVGWISAALATSSFPYWSLMHISMAFWKPR